MTSKTLNRVKQAGLGLGVVAMMGIVLAAPAMADPHHNRGRGHDRGWHKPQRHHHSRTVVRRYYYPYYTPPRYVYAPPPVVYYPPEPSWGLNLIIPFNFD